MNLIRYICATLKTEKSYSSFPLIIYQRIRFGLFVTIGCLY